ncbi:MAG TPA: ComEC/Rec2 family competence protein, partial [Magnetospirillaceae bacterium]|nr:ComEC/Rec2 family competence protein [Magnetospirillaceae bacterium]
TGLTASSAGLVLAFLALRLEAEAAAPPSLGLPVGALEWVEGTLREDSAPLRNGGRRYDLQLEASGGRDGARATARGRLAVVVPARAPPLAAWSALRVRGRLSPDRSGLGLVLFAEAGDLETPGIRRPRARLRNRMRTAVLDALRRAGGEGGPLLEALILGCRDDLDLAISDDFRRAGCSHVLALSGQHLSILAALVAFMSAPVLGRRGGLAAAAAASCAFAAFVGPKPSLVRAALMTAHAAGARLSGRVPSVSTSLGASFLVQSLLWPGTVRDLSFQLSYLALAGLAALSPAFEYLLAPSSPPPVARALAASFAAQAAAGPRTLTAFGTLYPAGILAAALSAPLVAAYIWVGILGAAAAAALPFLEPGVQALLSALYWAILAVIRIFAAFPGLAVPEGPGRWAAAAVVAALALAVYAVPHVDRIRTRRRFSPELRFPQGPDRLPGNLGSGDAEALRAELPREPRHSEAPRRPV